MKYCARIQPLFILLFCTLGSNAQTVSVEMADTMRSNGKIYVVVAVVLLILVSFFVYLIRLDRKLKTIEDQSSKQS
jgi:hypothetical protein